MAEFLGVFASGIAVAQLASSLTSSIISLKGYFDQIKDAPANLIDLMAEIESLNLTLAHIAEDVTRTAGMEKVYDNEYLRNSYQWCQKSVDELTRLVEVLREKVEGGSKLRRVMGRVKVVWTKDEIKSLKGRMKSAIRLMTLACQCHTSAMMKLQPEIIIIRLAQQGFLTKAVQQADFDNEEDRALTKAMQEVDDIKEEEELCTSSNYNRKKGHRSQDLVTQHYQYWTSSPAWLQSVLGSFEYASGRSGSKRMESSSVSVKYRSPWWLVSRALDLQMARSASGWKMALQIRRILPWDSPILDSIEKGNIEVIRNMLRSREILLTDRFGTPEMTLLHLAAFYQSSDVCKLLVDEGVDGTALNTINRTAFFSYIRYPTDKHHEMTRVLIDSSEHIDLIENLSIFEEFQGPASIFSLLQKEAYPPYHSISVSKRLEIIRMRSPRMYLDEFVNDEHKIIALILHNGKPPFTKEMVCEQDTYGNTILHHVLERYSYVERPEQDDGWIDNNFKLDFDHELYRWIVLIRDILAAKPDLSHKNSSSQTPLAYFIEVLVDSSNRARRSPETGCTIKLRAYLKELQIAGIDLEEYGEKETQSSLRPQGNLRACNTRWPEDWSLIGFDYGPQPSDWHLRFGEPIGVYAYLHEFWEMVEEERWEWERCRAPGSWVDSDLLF